MARAARKKGLERGLEIAGGVWAHPLSARARGALAAGAGVWVAVALATWSVGDPSFNASASGAPGNLLGGPGAVLADLVLQTLGVAGAGAALLLLVLGLSRLAGRGDDAAMLTFYTDGQNPEAARRVEAFVGQQLPALVAHLEQVRAAAR